jgi:hypothetical protein
LSTSNKTPIKKQDDVDHQNDENNNKSPISTTTTTTPSTTTQRTQRLNSLLKFKIFSKSFDLPQNHNHHVHNQATQPPPANTQIERQPQIVINSPAALAANETNHISNQLQISSSACSTPFLLAPNNSNSNTNTNNTSENRKQRVSLPTPITQEQQRKLIEQQQQQQHQKKSNDSFFVFFKRRTFSKDPELRFLEDVGHKLKFEFF